MSDLVALLVALQVQFWPDAPMPAYLAGQVQAESNWKPAAQLKSKREHGCGLAQFTRAYDARGLLRFDALTEAKRLDPSLSTWTWETCTDAHMQLTAMVLTNKGLYKRVAPLAATPDDAVRMVLSAYNGGFGALLQDRNKCLSRPGCDPRRWSRHVELSSYKSNQPSIYGRSFFQINRDYVHRVVDVYRPRYESYFRSAP